MLELTNTVLFEKAEPVKNLQVVNDALLDMISIMNEKNGVGLAAPQVGIPQRFFIMRKGPTNYIAVMVNPKLVSPVNETILLEEGCLSHPGVWKEVPRSASVNVAFYDEIGCFFLETLHGQDAHIFQHEMDHLNGKTIADTILA